MAVGELHPSSPAFLAKEVAESSSFVPVLFFGDFFAVELLFPS